MQYRSTTCNRAVLYGGELHQNILQTSVVCHFNNIYLMWLQKHHVSYDSHWLLVSCVTDTSKRGWLPSP